MIGTAVVLFRRFCRVGRMYPELVAVVLAAAIGLGVRRPFAWLDAHQGIDIALAVLVFATGVTVEPGALRRIGRHRWRLATTVAAGVTVLPALSWAASRLVAAGTLRNGVLTVGLAPAEIASVATTAMAGGDPALAAGILVGSTVATIAVAGPILDLEAGGSGVALLHVATNLLLVVALPLAAGLLLRAIRPLGPRGNRVAATTAFAALAALVALVAAEARLSSRYGGVAAGLAVFLAGCALMGRLLGRRAGREATAAVLLTTSMRDFAIAADLATAAFGPPAAAPLALYGVGALVWGTVVAGRMRSARPAGDR